MTWLDGVVSLPAAAPGIIDSFTTEDLAKSLLIGAVVLLISVAAVRLATRSGLPTLLIYLGIGLLLGDSGLGISFSDPALTDVLGYAALVLILAEGGITTKWPTLRPSVLPAALLSTVGVMVSVGTVGVGAYLLLPHLSWKIAFLLGAIVTSTDAAAVFSVLRRVPLPHKLTSVLEAESGFNDAPVVLLVVALSQAAGPEGPAHAWWFVVIEAVIELAGGAAIGLALGYLLGKVMKASAPGSSGLFSIGVLAVIVLAYSVADLAHTSGFIATYLCALVLGNLELPHFPAVRGFAQALGWLAQIGLFVLLGLLASPPRLIHQIVPALVIGIVLLLIARPLSVLTTLSWFRFSLREQAFMSWAGLRGAVPVVLATVPLTLGTPHTEWMFDLVFVLVVVFTLVQAPTLPRLAHLLRITDPSHTVDLELEATPLEELGADVLQVRIGEGSRLAGVAIHELRLPEGANVTLLVRDKKGVVPQPRTAMRHGDRLLIVTTAGSRKAAIRRIRAVSQEGRMAGWRSGGAPVDGEAS